MTTGWPDPLSLSLFVSFGIRITSEYPLILFWQKQTPATHTAHKYSKMFKLLKSAWFISTKLLYIESGMNDLKKFCDCVYASLICTSEEKIWSIIKYDIPKVLKACWANDKAEGTYTRLYHAPFDYFCYMMEELWNRTQLKTCFVLLCLIPHVLSVLY